MTTLVENPSGIRIPIAERPTPGMLRTILSGISRFLEWLWPSESDFTFEKWNQLENRRLIATRIGEQFNSFPIR